MTISRETISRARAVPRRLPFEIRPGAPTKVEGARPMFPPEQKEEYQNSSAESKHKIRGLHVDCWYWSRPVDDDLALDRFAGVVVDLHFAGPVPYPTALQVAIGGSDY